ncbi:MAG: hypothetical protein K0M67_21410 [Thiobacillus sp.]|nr:hypothetical protein [Thiobacillus sp.]
MGKKIGVSKSTNLIHRLMWSPDDGCLLVAIQEIVSGTVLTVLTLDMYRRDYEGNLSENRIRLVINQMVHAGNIPISMWRPGDKQECVTVHAHLAGISSVVSLGRWTRDLLSADLRDLGKSAEFWTWVAHRLSAKGMALEGLVRVEARFTSGHNWEIPFVPTVWS